MPERVTSGRATRSRVLLGVLVGVLVVGALTACQPTTSTPPVTANNRPTSVPGATNGQLAGSALVDVSGCAVYARVAPSLYRMLADAAADGVTIRGLSCYRDYAGQVQAREYWCGQGSCGRAAVPGTSNHGWGKAVDFTGANNTFDFRSPGFAWLAANAWRYGWIHPDWAAEGQPTDEPWHWEWVGDGGTLYPGALMGPQSYWTVTSGPPGLTR
jgi:hypothetical protein